ncbi:MAG TPA: Type 1 glutamine amidotransferase-like domain-containing protein, partial [Candidatus Angelobacter sp.]|nr:Type 1 glutamine amidotransferase-like domain-containing protein [Candidatus Angelobacter sp.]
MSTAPIALVGSGEYLPVMTEIERALIDGRPPRYVQLATAAAPEGDASLRRWHELGRTQAERLGVEQVVVDVRSRADADDEGMAARVEGAGLVYLSGGNPAFLAETLRDTAVWRAILAAHAAGAALAGCSAGAMALTAWAPRMRDLVHPNQTTGLGLVPDVRVIPHFDKMLGWMPDVLRDALLHKPEGTTLLGIDEDTALVGGPDGWQVQGRQS